MKTEDKPALLRTAHAYRENGVPIGSCLHYMHPPETYTLASAAQGRIQMLACPDTLVRECRHKISQNRIGRWAL